MVGTSIFNKIVLMLISKAILPQSLFRIVFFCHWEDTTMNNQTSFRKKDPNLIEKKKQLLQKKSLNKDEIGELIDIGSQEFDNSGEENENVPKTADECMEEVIDHSMALIEVRKNWGFLDTIYFNKYNFFQKTVSKIAEELKSDYFDKHKDNNGTKISSKPSKETSSMNEAMLANDGDAVSELNIGIGDDGDEIDYDAECEKLPSTQGLPLIDATKKNYFDVNTSSDENRDSLPRRTKRSSFNPNYKEYQTGMYTMS